MSDKKAARERRDVVSGAHQAKWVPASVPGLIADLPVVWVAKIDDGDSLGEFDPEKRIVYLACTIQNRALALATYYHEMAHAALWDTGANHPLSKNEEEAICNAIALILTRIELGAGEDEEEEPPEPAFLQ